MPAPENTCDECGKWKREDFELCFECGQAAKEERDEPVLVEYAAHAGETELAVKFKLPGGFMGRIVPVPKSILVDDDALAKRFCVPRWWAEQENLSTE